MHEASVSTPRPAATVDGLPERLRLTVRLAGAAQRPVVLVAASSGAGKTTALRHFLVTRSVPHVAYRVDAETGLLGFLRGLSAALAAHAPGAHLSFAIAHERAIASPSPVAGLVAWFCEHVGHVRTTIVLDDLHNADGDPAVAAFLVAVVNATRDRLRWIIAGRTMTALPVAAWLAHGIADLPLEDDELRFTRDEALALAGAISARVPEQRVDALVAATGGRPANLALALALSARGTSRDDDGIVAAATSYASLARCYLERCDPAQRDFLMRTAVLREMDVALLEDVGWPDAVDRLRAIAQDAPFLLTVVGGIHRYDEPFRAHLEERLRGEPGDAFGRALHGAAAALERAGRASEALRCYCRGNARQEILRVLEAHGFTLLDRGDDDVVAAALALIPEPQQHDSAAVLALRGMLDARLGRFDTAEAWFRLGIETAGDDVATRTPIVARYALDLLRRSRTDFIPLLEPLAADASVPAELRASFAATLAAAYAIDERSDDASAAVERALADLPPDADERVRARILHQAAYVALRRGEAPRARRFAEAAIAIGLRLGLYDLVAPVATVLYEIAYAFDDDWAAARRHIDRVAECAMKSGNVSLRTWAFLAAYYLEAERGDAEALRRIEQSLSAADIAQNIGETNDTLLPGQALRAAWHQDFARAYRLLATSASHQPSPERRLLRWSEVALYAAAAALRAEARVAFAEAIRELRALRAAADPDERDLVHAVVYLVLTSLLLGRTRSARAHLDRLHRDEARRHRCEPRPSIATFIDVADAALAYWAAAGRHSSLRAALDRLRERHLGGIAALVEALPSSARDRVPFAIS